MWWPIFLLQSALMAAASTIKNPNSENARKLRQVMLVLYRQMKATYAGDPDFQ